MLALRAGTSHCSGDNCAHVCIVRRQRKVPGRAADVRGGQLDAARAGLRQARQGQERQCAVALRCAAAGRTVRAGTEPRAADRPGPGLGIRTRGRVRLRRPGARLLRGALRHRQAGRRAVPAVRGTALLPPPGPRHVQEGAAGDGQGRAAGHRAQEAAGRDRSTPGPRSWPRANARRRSASSSTASCSSPTRTARSTRPWSKPRAARSAHRSIC